MGRKGSRNPMCNPSVLKGCLKLPPLKTEGLHIGLPAGGPLPGHVAGPPALSLSRAPRRTSPRHHASHHSRRPPRPRTPPPSPPCPPLLPPPSPISPPRPFSHRRPQSLRTVPAFRSHAALPLGSRSCSMSPCLFFCSFCGGSHFLEAACPKSARTRGGSPSHSYGRWAGATSPDVEG